MSDQDAFADWRRNFAVAWFPPALQGPEPRNQREFLEARLAETLDQVRRAAGSLRQEVTHIAGGIPDLSAKEKIVGRLQQTVTLASEAAGRVRDNQLLQSWGKTASASDAPERASSGRIGGASTSLFVAASLMNDLEAVVRQLSAELDVNGLSGEQTENSALASRLTRATIQLGQLRGKLKP